MVETTIDVIPTTIVNRRWNYIDRCLYHRHICDPSKDLIHSRRHGCTHSNESPFVCNEGEIHRSCIVQNHNHHRHYTLSLHSLISHTNSPHILGNCMVPPLEWNPKIRSLLLLLRARCNHLCDQSSQMLTALLS